MNFSLVEFQSSGADIVGEALSIYSFSVVTDSIVYMAAGESREMLVLLKVDQGTGGRKGAERSKDRAG